MINRQHYQNFHKIGQCQGIRLILEFVLNTMDELPLRSQPVNPVM